jgi:hypothetical protein
MQLELEHLFRKTTYNYQNEAGTQGQTNSTKYLLAFVYVLSLSLQ